MGILIWTAENKKLDDDIALKREIITDNTAAIEGERYKSVGLRPAAAELIEKINNIKVEIEQLTGGHYERNVEGNLVTADIMGNTIMLRFKNFMKVVPSKTEFDEEPDKN